MHGRQQHVAIFTSSMEGGGAQRSMLNLAAGLARRGCRVDLLLARAVGPYLSQVPPEVRLVDLGCGRVLASIPALVRYLRRERPAAMLSSLVYVNIVALWARQLSRVPVRLVVNEQNTLSRFAAHAVKWRNRCTPVLARQFYPWADGIVAVSEGVRQDLAQTLRLPLERVDVIYNPSVDARQVRSQVNGPVAHPWFEPGSPPVVLSVGRLHPQKDYVTLIRAFQRVRQRREARLLILGAGDQRTELETVIRDCGLQDSVQLPGFADNPFAYMARAALYVLSSRWEGLPTVLVEALCCGTPVVATDCPSGPREILREPRFGRLIPVGDIEAMAAAMDESLAVDRVSPPAESWQPFEVDVVAARYQELLFQGA